MAFGLALAYLRWVIAMDPSARVRSSSVSPLTIAYRRAHSANSWPGDISPYGQAKDRLSSSGTTTSAGGPGVAPRVDAAGGPGVAPRVDAAGGPGVAADGPPRRAPS